MAENSSVISTWPTECPFSEVGCSSSLSTSQEYSQHLAQNTEQHLQMVVDLHKGTEIVSPLEKLNTIKSEIEYLEGTLESLGVRQIPALECIKTKMKQPDVGINSLGDKCTFRMSGFIQLRDSSQKWLSPPFLLRGTYQLRLIVYPNGTGAGLGTHLSVFLVLPLTDQFEWPISLPRHLGVRVELLVETDGSVSDSGDDSDSGSTENFNGTNEIAYALTWRPKSAKALSDTATRNKQSQKTNTKHMQDAEIHRRVSKILPPWCQPPPSDTTVESRSPTRSNPPTNFPVALENTSRVEPEAATHRQRKQRRTGVSQEIKPQEDGITLFSAEKFATRSHVEELIREFNSLVFQISICLV